MNHDMISGMKTPGVRRVTISLPSDLWDWAEKERRRRGLNRSQLITTVLAAWRSANAERARIERYAVAYGKKPVTKEEATWADAAAEAMLAERRPR